jgi:hypothetical protein
VHVAKKKVEGKEVEHCHVFFIPEYIVYFCLRMVPDVSYCCIRRAFAV